MARQTKSEQLTHSQIATLRNTASRKTAQLMARLAKNAMGELDSEMTAGQIKSAIASVQFVLPAMQSVEWTDETPDHGNPLEIEAQAREMLRATLKSMSPDEIESLLADQH